MLSRSSSPRSKRSLLEIFYVVQKQFFMHLWIVSRFTAKKGNWTQIECNINEQWVFLICPCVYLVLLAKRLKRKHVCMNEWVNKCPNQYQNVLNKSNVCPLNNNENVCMKITITSATYSDGRFLFGDSFDSIEIKFKYPLIEFCVRTWFFPSLSLSPPNGSSFQLDNRHEFAILRCLYISPTSIIFCLPACCLRSPPVSQTQLFIGDDMFDFYLPTCHTSRWLYPTKITTKRTHSQTPFV